MTNKLVGAALVSLPILAGGIGLVYANAQKQSGEQTEKAATQGYICPATGEELPCESCCPLSSQK